MLAGCRELTFSFSFFLQDDNRSHAGTRDGQDFQENWMEPLVCNIERSFRLACVLNTLSINFNHYLVRSFLSYFFFQNLLYLLPPQFK